MRDRIRARLSEPSTWAALSGAFAGLTAYSMAGTGGEVVQWVSLVGLFACSAMGALLGEKGPRR